LNLASRRFSPLPSSKREEKRKENDGGSPAQPKIIVCKYGTAHKNYADVFSANILGVARATGSQTITQGPITIFCSDTKKFLFPKFFCIAKIIKKNYFGIK